MNNLDDTSSALAFSHREGRAGRAGRRASGAVLLALFASPAAAQQCPLSAEQAAQTPYSYERCSFVLHVTAAELAAVDRAIDAAVERDPGDQAMWEVKLRWRAQIEQQTRAAGETK